MSTRVLRSHTVYTIAAIGFIFTLHAAIPIYSNSSFLGLFADAQTIGLIYMAGAAVGILGFLIAPILIRRFGNYTMAMLLICVQIAIFYGLISSTSAMTLAILFILQSAVVSIIGLTLDIFLEVYTDDDHVGTVRGLYTATLNASWVVAPLIGSLLINGSDNYRNTYVAALAMLFPLLYLIYRNFPRFEDPKYTHLSLWRLAKHISSNADWMKLFTANVILQTFYSWMVIYSPIYLNKNIGFSWEEIGIILVVMLIPFPLIQYPLGKLADKRFGEKEMMAVGFAIMGISTMFLSLSTLKSVMLWAVLFLITRIGAAIAEIMMETYFFKKVSTRDTSVLSSYRITRPLSYFLAPVVMMLGLLFTDMQNMFVIIGAFSLLALYPALTIRDTN
jgi:MFS family permease